MIVIGFPDCCGTSTTGGCDGVDGTDGIDGKVGISNASISGSPTFVRGCQGASDFALFFNDFGVDLATIGNDTLNPRDIFPYTLSWWANISRIVFGVSLKESSKLFGPEILVSTEYLNRKSANKIEIKGGILEEEILKLYYKFKN